MVKIVDGNQIAQQILNQLSRKIKALKTKPHLAVVLVGDDRPSGTYVRKKESAANSIGIKFSLYKFPATITESKLISEIKKIQQQKLSGIIVQLPLPKNLDKKKVLNALDPEIDVDFLTWESLGKVVIGENLLIPPSPGAILEILKRYNVKLKGKDVVLVGMGDLIGKPLTNILMHMPVTLTTCNKDTKNLAEVTRSADILITGVGKPKLIKAGMVKKGAVVIDAGVSFIGKKMHGDVDFDEVSKVAGIITPTPGGVGPITVAKLLENTVNNSHV
ncbi:MAG: bifunctional 5,10-methylene-tetrahydrofolate dehydrogenase/5,10-methylene-tetrahydrofolate cyclohydrolase [Candidatus Doudnabacteria bacterium]|nr:bifunctional 5,10-methylene-tetrahydrofolate dehydrogenase/5,10-methylene-tetrahydrofolate cyclohydrolase [Candidatus Doudnabacteria bacterium]